MSVEKGVFQQNPSYGLTPFPARPVLQACCLGRDPAVVRQGSEVDREMPFVCRGFCCFSHAAVFGLLVWSSHAGSNNAGR